jgi:hypothetical protein
MRPEQVLFKPDRIELPDPFDPVKIEMMQLDRLSASRTVIDIEKRKGRA